MATSTLSAATLFAIVVACTFGGIILLVVFCELMQWLYEKEVAPLKNFPSLGDHNFDAGPVEHKDVAKSSSNVIYFKNWRSK